MNARVSFSISELCQSSKVDRVFADVNLRSCTHSR